jgi:Zn-dependent protease
MGSITIDDLLRGLLLYLCFIPVLTFHEFAHAWTSHKCGDDTAKNEGRVSLNPLVHMELIGTVILPLAAIFMSMVQPVLAGFIIGWGKPVPVDLDNLRNPRRDDTLIALAGPLMNLILAVICMGAVKVGFMMKLKGMNEAGEIIMTIGYLLTQVNLVLAFFNMLPIPPLDGSHVLWNAAGFSWESYFKATQFGFLLVIVAINIPWVRDNLDQMVGYGLVILLNLFRVRL